MECLAPELSRLSPSVSVSPGRPERAQSSRRFTRGKGRRGGASAPGREPSRWPRAGLLSGRRAPESGGRRLPLPVGGGGCPPPPPSAVPTPTPAAVKRKPSRCLQERQQPAVWRGIASGAASPRLARISTADSTAATLRTQEPAGPPARPPAPGTPAPASAPRTAPRTPSRRRQPTCGRRRGQPPCPAPQSAPAVSTPGTWPPR